MGCTSRVLVPLSHSHIATEQYQKEKHTGRIASHPFPAGFLWHCKFNWASEGWLHQFVHCPPWSLQSHIGLTGTSRLAAPPNSSWAHTGHFSHLVGFPWDIQVSSHSGEVPDRESNWDLTTSSATPVLSLELHTPCLCRTELPPECACNFA